MKCATIRWGGVGVIRTTARVLWLNSLAMILATTLVMIFATTSAWAGPVPLSVFASGAEARLNLVAPVADIPITTEESIIELSGITYRSVQLRGRTFLLRVVGLSKGAPHLELQCADAPPEKRRAVVTMEDIDIKEKSIAEMGEGDEDEGSDVEGETLNALPDHSVREAATIRSRNHNFYDAILNACKKGEKAQGGLRPLVLPLREDFGLNVGTPTPSSALNKADADSATDVTVEF